MTSQVTGFIKTESEVKRSRKRKTADTPESDLDVVLEERPDTRALAYLRTLPGEDGALVRKYQAKLQKCRGRVKYTLTPDSNDGRLYAKDGMMQSFLPSRLVNVMLAAKCVDIDFVNCQPALLVQYAHKNGWACPAWTAYARDRDSTLSLIMNYASVGRDDAKKEVVSFLYGGGNKGTGFVPPELRQELVQEAHTLMRNVCLLHPDIVKSARAKKPDNVEGSVMARVLQTEERHCLLALRTFMASEGYEFAVIKHDGGLVYTTTVLPDSLLLRAKAYIQRVTSYTMDLVVKPMSTAITVPAEFVEPPPWPSFLQLKAEFERFHAKVDSYYVVLGDGEGGGFGYTMYSRHDMLERYRHILYLEDTGDEDGPHEEKFIVSWMDHPDIRRYVDMDMYPPGCDVPCPHNVLNTWLGFAAERLPTLGPDEVDAAAEGGRLVLDHMRQIECNGDESLYRYRLGWWAHLYQFPGKKPRVGLILVGLKGAGKDTSIRAHLPLIGRHLICQTRVVENVLGNFNSAISGKLMLWVEELNLVDTAGSSNLMDGAKALITSEVQQITAKGKESVCRASFHRFIGTTNERRSVPMTSDNRQFCLVEVSDAQRNKPQYFDRLYAAMGNTKVQRWLFEFFKNPQLLADGWVSTVFPATDALRANARASQPQEVLFAMHLCETHTGTHRISSDDLYEIYRTWHSHQNVQSKTFAKTNFTAYMNDKALLKRVSVDERVNSLRFKRINFDSWRQALVSAGIITQDEALESTAAAEAAVRAKTDS